MTLERGDVVNMKSFAHTTDGGVTFTYRRPGKTETYVFMFMGIETKDHPLDLDGILRSLGWVENITTIKETSS